MTNVSLLCLMMSLVAGGAFSPHAAMMVRPRAATSTSTGSSCRYLLPAVDIAMMDAAIAVVSAAAGAASQFPRIQQLERDLDSARSALTEVRVTEMIQRIHYSLCHGCASRPVCACIGVTSRDSPIAHCLCGGQDVFACTLVSQSLLLRLTLAFVFLVSWP